MVQLPCKHLFDIECIIPWLKNSGMCPDCCDNMVNKWFRLVGWLFCNYFVIIRESSIKVSWSLNPILWVFECAANTKRIRIKVLNRLIESSNLSVSGNTPLLFVIWMSILNFTNNRFIELNPRMSNLKIKVLKEFI